MDGVALRLVVKVEGDALVVPVSDGLVVVHANRGVVEEPIASPLHRESEAQLPVHLCAGAAEPRVESDGAER